VFAHLLLQVTVRLFYPSVVGHKVSI
jgi:hypothetical protein